MSLIACYVVMVYPSYARINDHELGSDTSFAWHMQEELAQAHVTEEEAVQARNDAGRTYELRKRERKASMAHKVGPLLYHSRLDLHHAQRS